MTGSANGAIRMVASDLDGTLIRSDGTISPRTVAALHAAVDAGLRVVFVTGRPPRWLHEVADATGHTGVVVAANGATLYDLEREQPILSHPLQPTDLATITALLRDKFTDVTFAVDYGDTFAMEPTYRHDWSINPTTDRQGNPLPAPLVCDLASLTTRPALKLLAKDRLIDPDEFREQAAALLGSLAAVTSSSPYGLLEIATFGISKATGLAEVAARNGIDASEVAAIGDMPNDVPMLEWAGRSYAVANAHAAALAAADSVLVSNDDDAVAILIESILRA